MLENDYVQGYIDGFIDIEERWSDCILITGAGGCRTDFVLGWLLMMIKSCQYSTPWIINCYSGQSINNLSTQFYDKFFLWDEPMSQAPRCIKWLLNYHSKDVDRCIIQKTHKPINLIQVQLLQDLRDKTKILDIISDDDLDTAVNATWEFVIKTFVPKNPKNVLEWYDYEKSFDFNNDQEYCSAVYAIADEFIEKKSWVRTSLKSANVVPSLKVPYRDLLSTHGKYRLADILGFDLNDHGSHIWDSGILLARTTDKIQALGQVWSKDDIRSRILQAHPDITRS